MDIMSSPFCELLLELSESPLEPAAYASWTSSQTAMDGLLLTVHHPHIGVRQTILLVGAPQLSQAYQETSPSVCTGNLRIPSCTNRSSTGSSIGAASHSGSKSSGGVYNSGSALVVGFSGGSAADKLNGLPAGLITESPVAIPKSAGSKIAA